MADDAAPRARLTPTAATVAAAGSVLLVAAVAGMPRSSLVPVLPPGAGALAPFRWAGAVLGGNAFSPNGRVALATTSLAVAGTVFLLALRAAWQGSLSLRRAVFVAAAFHVIAVSMPLFVSRDAFQYAMYGRIRSVHEANPYVAEPREFRSDPAFRYVAPEWRNTTAFYGPAFVLLLDGTTGAIRSLAGVVFTLKVIAGAASMGVVLLVAWLARALFPERASFAVILFGWNPVVLFDAVAGAHSDLLLAFFVTAGLGILAAAGRSRARVRFGADLLTVGLLTLAALVKSPAALALILYILVSVLRHPRGSRLRPLVANVGVVAVMVVAFAAPFLQLANPTLGLTELARYGSALAPPSFFRFLVAIVLPGDESSGVVRVASLVVRLAFPLVMLGAFVAIARWVSERARTAGAIEQGGSWGWAFLLFLLTAPILFPWYLVWVLPFVWLLPSTPRVSAIAMSAFLPLFQTVAESTYSSGAYFGAITLGISIAGPALFFVLVHLVRDLARRMREGKPLEDISAPRQDQLAVAGSG
jgi:hypothetical protein